RCAKDGRAVWLQASYNPIKDKSGKVTKVIKFAADITAAKLQAIDFAGKIAAIGRAQAVIEFTPAGDIITANDNFLNSLGYGLDEIKGKHHSLFCERDYVQSPEYKHFWADLAAGNIRAGEFRRTGKGGRDVYIQASYNPIFDDTGTVVKIVKFATDMTEIVKKRLRNDSLSSEINHELGEVINQMVTATEMTSGASTASTETGSIINSVAAAAEELSQSVREIAQNMTQAKSGVEGVFKHAESANASANSLSESANAMNNIVTLIQDIASQINLLALNATIESARAGEAGRGFAVVATEVKSLANQAAASTKTIADEIARMQSVSHEVVEALSLISTSMNTVLENVTGVAGAIEQQQAVTGEISGNMQAAVSAVQQIEESLGHINTTFSNVANASEQVKQSVEELAA
ncbi:MAG: methyl-accepting chemotaxis protein, partial [Asticcacaulis sp.]